MCAPYYHQILFSLVFHLLKKKPHFLLDLILLKHTFSVSEIITMVPKSVLCKPFRFTLKSHFLALKPWIVVLHPHSAVAKSSS